MFYGNLQSSFRLCWMFEEPQPHAQFNIVPSIAFRLRFFSYSVLHLLSVTVFNRLSIFRAATVLA